LGNNDTLCANCLKLIILQYSAKVFRIRWRSTTFWANLGAFSPTDKRLPKTCAGGSPGDSFRLIARFDSEGYPTLLQGNLQALECQALIAAACCASRWSAKDARGQARSLSSTRIRFSASKQKEIAGAMGPRSGRTCCFEVSIVVSGAESPAKLGRIALQCRLCRVFCFFS